MERMWHACTLADILREKFNKWYLLVPHRALSPMRKTTPWVSNHCPRYRFKDNKNETHGGAVIDKLLSDQINDGLVCPKAYGFHLTKHDITVIFRKWSSEVNKPVCKAPWRTAQLQPCQNTDHCVWQTHFSFQMDNIERSH